MRRKVPGRRAARAMDSRADGGLAMLVGREEKKQVMRWTEQLGRVFLGIQVKEADIHAGGGAFIVRSLSIVAPVRGGRMLAAPAGAPSLFYRGERKGLTGDDLSLLEKRDTIVRIRTAGILACAAKANQGRRLQASKISGSPMTTRSALN